jgi:hypothetical protein
MKKLYLYSLGPDAKHSPFNICCPVPKKIDENEIFFGPCMALLREKFYRDYLQKAVIQGKESQLIRNEIFLVGINSTSKGLPRRIIWAGKIKELTTFKGAWDKINSSKIKEKYYYLINGKDSPLLVEPILDNNGNFIGYKQRKNGTHKGFWKKDLCSNYKNLEEIFNIKATKNEIKLTNYSKREQIFNRDICLWLENIFYVNGLGIILDEDFLKIIKKIKPNKKDTINNRNPFGTTNKKPIVYRNYGLQIENEHVDKFISLVKEKGNKLPSLNIRK